MHTLHSLYTAFSNIESQEEFDNFIVDLLTPREIKTIGERWEIAQLLFNTNLPQEIIAQRVGGSPATVVRVARFLYAEKFGGYFSVLSKLFPMRARKIAKDQIGKVSSASRRHHP
ncbi:MAG: trp operon repressor [Alphaproteobacteria bacterium]|nr:trp operon repressor [Alphaproteobacteria bacterium]